MERPTVESGTVICYIDAVNLLDPSWTDLEILPRKLAVAMRRATEAHAIGLLSESDVYALPDLTTVEIVWGGGNGPHRYDVIHYYDRPYAVVPIGHPYRVTIDRELQAGRFPRDLTGMQIDNVGAGLMCTRVRLPTTSPWPSGSIPR